VATVRDRIKKAVSGRRGIWRTAPFTTLFLTANQTRCLCLLAAHEPVGVYEFFRMTGKAALYGNAPIIDRLEKRGLIGRFASSGQKHQLYLDPAFPAYTELRTLLRAIGREHGVVVGPARRSWMGLKRMKPPPRHPIRTVFGNESRTLTIILPHLLPGVMRSPLLRQCGIKPEANGYERLEPVVSDGLLEERRLGPYVFYGPNPDLKWAGALRRFIAQCAKIEPNFAGRVEALRAEQELYGSSQAAKRYSRQAFGKPSSRK
jgi:hypothetical protein